MQVTAYCPECLTAARFETAAAPAELPCARCPARQKVSITEALRDANLVDRCVLCGCGHLYIEKDFNRPVGVAVIAVSIVGSGIAWAYSVYVSVGILAAAALLDFLVWTVSKERTICYRCQAEYRGAAANPSHERYDLGIAGRFADDYDEQRELHQK